MILPFSDGLVRTWACGPDCARLADRHYSRQSPGSLHFTGNGRKIVLRDSFGLVVFVWMWNYSGLRLDGQMGYCCTLFRNESGRRSSALILEAESAAVEEWGNSRAFTYVDPRKVLSRNPGYCFKAAGWTHCGYSKDGKHILEKYL